MSEDNTEGSGASEHQDLTEDERVLKENEALLADLKAKYGRLGIFYDPDEFEGLLVCAKPQKPAIYREFRNFIASDNKMADKTIATFNFALNCVVHPSREAAKTILDKLPFLADRVAGKVADLSGGGTRELGKD